MTMKSNIDARRRGHVLAAAALFICLPLGAAFAGQVQWNEVPAPSGENSKARFFPSAYRTDTVDIPLRADGGEIEYKVKMKAGDTMVYSWEAVSIADPGLLYSEFHGHTDPVPNASGGGSTGTLMFYRKASGGAEHGSLTAPFEGIHGWYLQNDSPAPVTVRLRLSGFYEIVPNQIPNP